MPISAIIPRIPTLQPARPLSTGLLSSHNVRLPTITAPASANSGGLTFSAAYQAVGETHAKAQINSAAISDAQDMVIRARQLVSMASMEGAPRDEINAELSIVKESLKNVTTTIYDSENWLNDTLGTPGIKSVATSVTAGPNGARSVQTTEIDTRDMTLYSDSDAQAGVLTASYGGYHLLSSAGTAGSSKEISISDATTAEDIAGMMTALEAITTGLSSAQNALRPIFEQSNNALDVDALPGLTPPKTNAPLFNDTDFDAIRERATSVRDQLVASRLSIMNSFNSQPSIMSLLR